MVSGWKFSVARYRALMHFPVKYIAPIRVDRHSLECDFWIMWTILRQWSDARPTHGDGSDREFLDWA
jgi:hypothetical protein